MNELQDNVAVGELGGDQGGELMGERVSVRRRVALAMELVILFVGGPLVMVASPIRLPIIGILVLIAVVVFLWLRRQDDFDRNNLWRWGAVRTQIGSIFLIWVTAAVVLTAGVWLFMPEALFSFPRRVPHIWIIVMFAYPVFSVYAQEVIFRGFIFRRYRDLLPGPYWMIGVSAAVFGWGHVVMGGRASEVGWDQVFLNSWVSIVLSGLLGVVLGWRYLRSKSLPAVCVEHALYGNLVFTIGLGQFFYAGFHEVGNRAAGG